MNDPLVSVIIPAFNAERWIDRTLRSLRSQTYRHLEIIVVDDGSVDSTGAIVAGHVEQDDRVSVIWQSNAGIAAARNRGLEAASGQFIAPVDADDLCSPDRIRKQVEALLANSLCAVAYTWSALIDEDDIIFDGIYPMVHGDVREELYLRNFVGNGSSALVRADALREVGGYETCLKAKDAEGCEDWLVMLRLAELYHFVVIPELLTGYRQSSNSTSSSRVRMFRSHNLVVKLHAAQFPHARLLLKTGQKHNTAELVREAILHRKHLRMAKFATSLALTSPIWAMRVVLSNYKTQYSADEAESGPHKKNQEATNYFLYENP